VPKRVLQAESARNDARVGQGAIRTDRPPEAGEPPGNGDGGHRHPAQCVHDKGAALVLSQRLHDPAI